MASYSAFRASASSANVDAFNNAKATSSSNVVANADQVLGDARIDGDIDNNGLTSYALRQASDEAYAASSNGYNVNVNSPAFHSAVSYAANSSIATFLEGKAGAAKAANAPISVQASAASKAASSKASVASTAARVANIQSNIAGANLDIANFVWANTGKDANDANSRAQFADSLLRTGATTDLASLTNFVSSANDIEDFEATNSADNKALNFASVLNSVGSAKTQIASAATVFNAYELLSDNGSAVMSSANGNTITYATLNSVLSNVVSGLSSAATRVKNDKTTAADGIAAGGAFDGASTASDVMSAIASGDSSGQAMKQAASDASLTGNMHNATDMYNILIAAASSVAAVNIEDTSDINNNTDVSLAFSRDAFQSAAKDALLSAGIDYDELNREASGIADVATAESSVSASSANIKNESSAAKLSDALNVAASSANSSLGTAQQSLASYFANSYSNDAKSESNVAGSASSALNSFYDSTIDSTAFTSANNAMNSAKTTEINDNNLAKAYGINVFNYSPKYVTLLRNAGLYNQGTRYPLPRGAVLEVTGVKIGKLGRLNYVTNYKGHEDTVYAGPTYVRQTYLDATDTPVDITVNGSCEVYSSANFAKSATGQKVSNITLHNCTVVNPTGTYKGFTAVRTPSGNYITANTSYVSENNGSTTPSKQPTTPSTPTTPSKPSNNPYGEVNF